MTHDEFIELQKKVYQPGEEWEKLFALYNTQNKTNLNPQMRTGYIVILSAIAKKQGFEFHPNDIQKYSPINKW